MNGRTFSPNPRKRQKSHHQFISMELCTSRHSISPLSCMCVCVSVCWGRPQGWLEPLSHRVQQNPSITVYPQIDSIHAANFRLVQSKNQHVRGIFRWKDLNFQWGYLGKFPTKSRNPAEPIRFVQSGSCRLHVVLVYFSSEPVSSGCLFCCCWLFFKSEFESRKRKSARLHYLTTRISVESEC